MPFQKEQQVFGDYARRKNLKRSGPRDAVLKVFLKTEKHLTAEELFHMVKKVSPHIGFATVYRALKRFCECGLCHELKCDDGLTRYEHLYGHHHHDHLICVKCGRFVEVVHPDIERLQDEIARRQGFALMRHKLELYGLCRACRRKS